jgi:hypothetical protein
MGFIWETALSLCDLGSSIIYYLLGRDLDQADILLIEQIFAHVELSSIEFYDENALRLYLQSELTNTDLLVHQINKLNKGIVRIMLINAF